MPFYCFHGKRFCYLWVQKKTRIPYLGIVEGSKIKHPQLIAENRSKMKIMLIDPKKDIPVRAITQLLTTATGLITAKIANRLTTPRRVGASSGRPNQ